MDNSPRLPTVSLLVSLGLVVAAVLSHAARGGSAVFHLSEVEIGLVAAAFSLAIFGVQGLISVLLEGRRLNPGIVKPRLTDTLSRGIIFLSVVLLVVAILLSTAIVNDWTPRAIGLVAGGGCVVLAILLVFYKEAFIGDEACFDEREDGVPW